MVLSIDNVRLPMEVVPEWMGSLCQDVIEYTAQTEDIHRPTLNPPIAIDNSDPTVLIELNASGAIQPSVPAIPDRLDSECRPGWMRLQSPKSEITALTCPRWPEILINTFCGFISR